MLTRIQSVQHGGRGTFVTVSQNFVNVVVIAAAVASAAIDVAVFVIVLNLERNINILI